MFRSNEDIHLKNNGACRWRSWRTGRDRQRRNCLDSLINVHCARVHTPESRISCGCVYSGVLKRSGQSRMTREPEWGRGVLCSSWRADWLCSRVSSLLSLLGGPARRYECRCCVAFLRRMFSTQQYFSPVSLARPVQYAFFFATKGFVAAVFFKAGSVVPSFIASLPRGSRAYPFALCRCCLSFQSHVCMCR